MCRCALSEISPRENIRWLVVGFILLELIDDEVKKVLCSNFSFCGIAGPSQAGLVPDADPSRVHLQCVQDPLPVADAVRAVRLKDQGWQIRS